MLLIWILPKQQILDSSKPKEFADVNFRFDENGRKFGEKREIASYEQFFLFAQWKAIAFSLQYVHELFTGFSKVFVYGLLRGFSNKSLFMDF